MTIVVGMWATATPPAGRRPNQPVAPCMTIVVGMWVLCAQGRTGGDRRQEGEPRLVGTSRRAVVIPYRARPPGIPAAPATGARTGSGPPPASTALPPAPWTA